MHNKKPTKIKALRKINYSQLQHIESLQEIAVRINTKSIVFCWFQQIWKNKVKIEPLCHANHGASGPLRKDVNLAKKGVEILISYYISIQLFLKNTLKHSLQYLL